MTAIFFTKDLYHFNYKGGPLTASRLITSCLLLEVTLT